MGEGKGEGDEFINGGWGILKEEDGDCQMLTSKESLEAWIKEKGLGKVTPNLVGFGYRLRKL